MKIIILVLGFTMLTAPSMAVEKLLAEGCFKETHPILGSYTTKVRIYERTVSVAYIDKDNKSLGGYRGNFYPPTELYVFADKISVRSVTLNDGMDGFLDDMNISITKTTVTFDSDRKPKGPHRKVKCL